MANTKVSQEMLLDGAQMNIGSDIKGVTDLKGAVVVPLGEFHADFVPVLFQISVQHAEPFCLFGIIGQQFGAAFDCRQVKACLVIRNHAMAAELGHGHFHRSFHF